MHHRHRNHPAKVPKSDDCSDMVSDASFHQGTRIMFQIPQIRPEPRAISEFRQDGHPYLAYSLAVLWLLTGPIGIIGAAILAHHLAA